ncbi:MAG TPA: hypothetical protein VJ976_02105 [Ornithinimicrobium sp.]|uniref:hypothetical protein n=1 Tax=Ornithinimicrobium sp. TaxID=1977084 RepID=UPI002B49488A|nr:hypothetical protein [Ornithinimicrobium sp.]HKJ11162.1 hypothetical protein [Ornithinimicrobium sp.]
MPTEPEYGQRAEGSALSGLFTTILVVGAVVAGFLAWHPDYSLDTVRRLVADTGVVEPSAVAPPPRGEGTFTYAMTQPDGKSPVGFDPCRRIEIVVNPRGAPEGYAQMVDTSVQRTSEATGLTMEVVGETSERNFTSRGTSDPVVVAWADSSEVPELAGDVRGLGGSTAMQIGGTRRYVSGMVVIDTEGSAFDLGGRVSQAILDHEFGHLVGLGHVDDAGELMNPTPTRLSYGPGDLEGLASLGQIECA